MPTEDGQPHVVLKLEFPKRRSHRTMLIRNEIPEEAAVHIYTFPASVVVVITVCAVFVDGVTYILKKASDGAPQRREQVGPCTRFVGAHVPHSVLYMLVG